MSPQMILPMFDPACRRLFHADRQGAQGQLVAMEIWNRATGRDLGNRRLSVYRCPRCGGYHVAAKVVRTRSSCHSPADPIEMTRGDHIRNGEPAAL
ncbi:hypothetical protein [Paludisphaera soli]|uniref:hypothetical protein n=1 Tax=Paludisphaera soli TaxID=2712865 RepID=UPI0013EC39B9|nr:hypothetical protein [Paludisphaera soli]